MRTQRGLIDVSDIWTPDRPLPDGPVLRRLTDRVGLGWELARLSRHIRTGYNPRLRTSLGRAMLDERIVELNPALLRDHPTELLPTLVHELAHLVVHARYPRATPHGREFRTLMVAAGFTGEATHSLPVAHLRKPRQRYVYLHLCPGCGRGFVARSLRRNLRCSLCGQAKAWAVHRAPATPAGYDALQRIRRQQGDQQSNTPGSTTR
jgi:predicted SprT family Zn-dependent metalloprotease